MDQDKSTGKFLKGNKAGSHQKIFADPAATDARKKLLSQFKDSDYKKLYNQFMALMLSDNPNVALQAYKLYHAYWVGPPAELSKPDQMDLDALNRLMGEREIG